MVEQEERRIESPTFMMLVMIGIILIWTSFSYLGASMLMFLGTGIVWGISAVVIKHKIRE